MGAIELDGKPLKFTAEFDSKVAEQDIESFLNKIKDLNSKSIGANTGVSKASKQYQSLLLDATKAFDAFSDSNKDFYSNIARSEMGLQKVKYEQSLLNKELRDGAITEQDYITRTAQLTSLKENLSKQIKDNKDQLKAYNDEAKKSVPFTSQDTRNELANAFRPGEGKPNYNAKEAFTNGYKERIREYNSQLDALKKKLNDGAISADQYAKSTSEIEASIKKANDDYKYFIDNIGKSSESLNKQKNVLDSVSKEYKKLIQDSEGAFSGLDPKVQALTNTLFSSRKELKDLSAAQKELDSLYKSGKITQDQYISSTRDLAVQQSGVKTRIAETTKELKGLENVERKAVGSIAEKTAKLTQLRERYINLSEAQRKNIAIGGQIEKEYQQISKELDKLNAKLNGTKSGGIAGVFSGLRGIAATLGIAFGTAQLVSFGKELFDLARKSEGVKNAFNLMSSDSSDNLEKLRAATKGTVSDFELMKVAVRANNFKIPMDALAKGLAFAKQRADATGQSVDYLVNSFVDGIGRKSTLVLDNLGISASELQAEVKKTGDFAEAAGNLIERSMTNAGYAVDTFGNRVSQASAYWDNMKLKASGFVADLFVELTELVKSDTWNEFWNRLTGWGNGRNVTIAKNLKKDIGEVESFLKNKNLSFNNLFGDDKTVNDDLRKSYKGMINDALKMRTQAEGAYKELLAKRNDKNFTVTDDDVKRYKDAYENANRYYTSLEKFRKQYGEVSTGPIADTKSIKELKDQLKELEGEKEILTNKAQIVEKEKQISKLRKQIAELDGTAAKKSEKAGESAAKKLAKELEKSEKEHISLLEKWAQTDADFSAKQLSRDQQEVASVRKKYADIKREIEKFNKATKGKRISLDGFDESVSTAVKNVQERQYNERKVKMYSDDYQNYLKYEDLKKEYGAKIADEQLGKYKSTFEQISGVYAGLFAKRQAVGLTSNEESYFKELEKLVVSHGEKIKEQNLNEYLDALKLSESYNDKRLAIEKKYQKAYAALKDKASDDQRKRLVKLQAEELSELALTNFQEESNWGTIFATILDKTKNQALEAVKELKNGLDILLKDGKITIVQYKQALDEINDVKSRVMTSDRGLLGELKSQIAILRELKKGTLAYDDTKRNIADIVNTISQSALEAARDIKGLFDELNIGSDSFRDGMSKTIEVLGNAGNLATSIAKGDVIGSVANGVKFLTSAISLFNTKDKKLQKQIDAYKEQLDSLGKAYDRLQNKLNNSDTNYYENQAQTLKNLEDQEKAIRAMMKAEEDKKKTDKEKIKSYRDQLDDINKRREEIEKAVRQMRLQTDINSLSQSITDALLSAFEAGEDGIESMDKAFDKFIKNALVNSLRLRLINPIVEDMVNKLDQYMAKNDNSPVGFNFDYWRDRLNGVGKTFNEAMENAFAGLGLEKESSSSTEKGSLKNDIQGISEQQAGRLEAEFGGLRIAQLQLLETTKTNHVQYMMIAQDKLTQLIAIQQNTYRTAENTERLANIENAIVSLNNKVSNSDAARRGAGLI
ncbi:hypothetical protein [Sphingobacterium thalpophilum]|uniref:hypothetical protein n=1 Tax=Sphingobacterium thalpophilum TaxID=259 RepID=UPI0024A721D7|nr:hypothetical protein [Sphingobacterium thalpophilum]